MKPKAQRGVSLLQQILKAQSHLKRNDPSEQGISLLLSLLMGLVIIGGVSGLMMRQLSERARGAGESYQQIAENAAANGFNQILSALNNTSPGEYLGYLFLNDHDGTESSKWQSDITLEQPCSKNKANGGFAPSWIVNTNRNDDGSTLRTDQMGDIQSQFKLRTYYGPKEGQSATFEVEGTVIREGSKNSYEARSLLRRSLYINSKVPTSDDWAVLAARNYELGDVDIEGSGHILWLMQSLGNFNDADSCNSTNLLAAVGADNRRETELAERIWPVVNLTGNQWNIPAPERFNRDGTFDQMDGTHRIWAFDDSQIGDPMQNTYGLQCDGTYSVVCARPSSNNPQNSQYENPIANNQINVETSTTSINQDACVVVNPFYKWQYFRRVLLQAGQTLDLSETDCRDNNNLEWRSSVEVEVPIRRQIMIKSSDLCNQNSNEDVCHVFIEHINLSQTQLFIQNDDRPVVLHLGLPPGGGSRRSDLGSHQYSLNNTSKICGSNSGAPKNCNNVAESFVIASSEGDVGTTCDNENRQSTLKFGGSNLPSAWINLSKGKVELNADTTMKGIIWANSICTGPSNGTTYDLTITTDGTNNKPVVENAEELWGWDHQKRYGRKVVRGVRGTGFDTFTRF
ncbi:hypothetical protein N9U66_00555 [Synechococcus sp. AH-736-M20]|nr:hypothetical protein [Synechococcus sp. AH-736-M20]